MLTSIHMENVDRIPKLASETMEEILAAHAIPSEDHVSKTDTFDSLFIHLENGSTIYNIS